MIGRNTPSLTASGFWNAAPRFGSSTSWANGVQGRVTFARSALVAVDCASAPHTAATLLSGEWQHAYSRELAAYPVASLRQQKYWSPVGRVDNVYGDRNLFCSCLPISADA